MKPSECKPGTPVLYAPTIGGRSYLGIVRDEPWQLLSGHWVTTLHQMEPAYGIETHRPGRTVARGVWIDPLVAAEPTRGPV